MKNNYLLLLLLFFFLWGCTKENRKVSNDSGLITELAIDKNDLGNYYFKIKIYNENNYDVGIIFIGEIRSRNYKGELKKLLTDTILKIYLPDTTLSSLEVENETVPLSNIIPELVIIKSKSSVGLNVKYEGNLYKDFGLNNRDIAVQLVIKPISSRLELSLGLTEKEFTNKYPNITLIKNDIISPIIDIE